MKHKIDYLSEFEQEFELDDNRMYENADMDDNEFESEDDYEMESEDEEFEDDFEFEGDDDTLLFCLKGGISGTVKNFVSSGSIFSKWVKFETHGKDHRRAVE